MKITCVVASLASPAWGHATLLKPKARSVQLVDTSITDWAFQLAGNCPNISCTWYTQQTVIPGQTTNCDPKLRSMGVNCDSKDPPDFPCGGKQKVPWCAPGTAPVYSPCGIYNGGYEQDSRDMRELPWTIQETWESGGEAEVAFSVTANHGGGYSYRLCPFSEGGSQVAEKCFEKHYLSFNDSTSWIVDQKGHKVKPFPAVRTTNGTFPKGSEWTRNPFPQEKGFGPLAAAGLYGRGPFPVSIMDTIKVPEVAPGHYVVSFRWDAEATKQVWQGCSDVMIKPRDWKKRETAPAVKPRPRAQRKHLCVGYSLGLDVEDCDAWVELYDALGGKNWTDCSQSRLDPCGCPLGSTEKHWGHKVFCSQDRNYKRLHEIYLMNNNVQGTIPAAVQNFTALQALDLNKNNIHGTVPHEICEMKELGALWLDHNPQLGGQIPPCMSKLTKIYALEMHECRFTGALPKLPYGSIADCLFYGKNNRFNCPLPDGAAMCGAVCNGTEVVV